MKRLVSLPIAVCAFAATSSASAATGPLQIPGAAGRVPGEIGFPLDAAWQHPVFPGSSPPSTDGRYQLRAPLSDGATCVRDVFVVGVVVRPASRPKLVGGTLRLHPEGSLLPRMKVERHGTAGDVTWFAGPLTASRAVTDRVNPPLEQGIAVVPAPSWATRAGRSLVVVRVVLDGRVEHLAADGITTVPATPAEATECFGAVRADIGARLRATLRGVSVQRRSA